MSKRKIHKKKNKKFPIIPVAISVVGLLLIVAALVFSNKSKPVVVDIPGTPVLEVEPKQIDYGDVKFNTNKTFSIKVTNAGDGTLRFKEAPYVQVLEGC